VTRTFGGHASKCLFDWSFAKKGIFLIMSDHRIFGGCLCGAVRYQIAAPLCLIEHCHCSMCRKAHGAGFSTNAVVATDTLNVTSGADKICEYESSPKRHKCFCSNCGSQLFIRRLDRPEITVVTLGTIDGDPGARPQRHVFVASKAPWLDIADPLPQYKIYPGFEPTEETTKE
jgi:hypothetical protein